MTTTPVTPHSHLHFSIITPAARAFISMKRAAAAAAAAAQPLLPPPPPWHAGIDAEFIGHAQNKGWKLDDPKEAFVAATKQAREAREAFRRAADRLVKLPAADAKPEDLRAYYERLGAPKEAKDYDLSASRTAIADTLRADARARRAEGCRRAIAQVRRQGARIQGDHRQHRSTRQARRGKGRAEKNWGDKLRLQPPAGDGGRAPARHHAGAVKALEGQIGYAAVMEAMRKIGANTREDTFVERGGGTTGEVTTREARVARKAELMADKAWADRYLAGGPRSARWTGSTDDRGRA
jgi:hypothetical protein